MTEIDWGSIGARSADRAERLAYISEFLEAAKSSGLVQKAIERAGEHGMEVAPRQEPPVVTGTVPGVTPGTIPGTTR